jgi:hypothetical protein
MGWGTFIAGQAIGNVRRAGRKKTDAQLKAQAQKEFDAISQLGAKFVGLTEKQIQNKSKSEVGLETSSNSLSFDERGNVISRETRMAIPPETTFNYWTVLFLCIFFGFLGVHRFKVGRTPSGALMLVTFGGFGFWWLIDFLFIVTRTFTDAWGRTIRPGA